MNRKVLKKAIEIAWCILVACFVIKVAGGNWFAVNIESPYFDKTLWLMAIVFSFTSYSLFTFYYLAICEVRNFKLWIHLALIPYFIGVTFLKTYLIPANFTVLIDLISMFIIPYILLTLSPGSHKKKSFGNP